MNDEEKVGPDIIPVGGSFGRILEGDPVNITFDGTNVKSVINIRIISCEENDGIEVEMEPAKIFGAYKDSFDFNNNLYYVENEVKKTANKFSEIKPETSDIYLWIPPKVPVSIDYVIEMEYTPLEPPTETRSIGRDNVIQKTFTHIILPSYTAWANQLREIIDIRREYYGRNSI